MGMPALAIDVTPRAVQIARSRGALALHRDVFDEVPEPDGGLACCWPTATFGISGDPVALLGRARELIAATGTIVIESGRQGSAHGERRCGCVPRQ
jgi:hypothetical protein